MSKNVRVTKDLYNDKKINIKIEGGLVVERNKFFLKLLSKMEGVIGFTTNKEYDSAFFYVKKDFCSLRDFFKRIVNNCGYGSGYNDEGGISYDQAVFMADSLCQQVILFSDYGWGFYCFLLDNVYVIDNHKFIYLGIEHLVELSGDGGIGDGGIGGQKKTINFTVPFPEKMMIMSGVGEDMNLFICPEIRNMKQLPFRIVYSATYYHLASLIIYCMFHKNICFSGDDVEDGYVGEDGKGGVLIAIYNTKLYWFLIRCLHNEHLKRILLWV